MLVVVLAAGALADKIPDYRRLMGGYTEETYSSSYSYMVVSYSYVDAYSVDSSYSYADMMMDSYSYSYSGMMVDSFSYFSEMYHDSFSYSGLMVMMVDSFSYSGTSSFAASYDLSHSAAYADEPSTMPTYVPTPAPSVVPTISMAPTAAPSPAPTTTPAPSGTPTGAPTGAPTLMPSAAPTSVPTMVPTSLPTPAPTKAVMLATVTYTMSVAYADSTPDAATLLEAVCFDDSFENVTANATRMAYLDTTGAYATDVDLSYVVVECSIINATNATTITNGINYADADVACEIELYREEASFGMDGTRFSSDDVAAKLLTFFQSRAVNNTAEFINLLLVLSRENPDSTCEDNLDASVSAVVSRRRRLQTGATLEDAMANSTVETVDVATDTAAPSGVPSAVPSSAPSEVPTPMPSPEPTTAMPTDSPSMVPTDAPTGMTCTSNNDCPDGQECVATRRRRRLAFGYATGVCLPS